jgi:hypothetical protein
MVAWLLLVTFVPIVIFSEGLHLLPGLGTCCKSYDFGQSPANHYLSEEYFDCHHSHDWDLGDSDLHDPVSQHQNSPHHNPSQQPYQHGSDESEDCCVVCEFCLLFNSVSISAGSILELPIVFAVDSLESVLFSGEFVSLFLARAPPMEV